MFITEQELVVFSPAKTTKNVTFSRVLVLLLWTIKMFLDIGQYELLKNILSERM